MNTYKDLHVRDVSLDVVLGLGSALLLDDAYYDAVTQEHALAVFRAEYLRATVHRAPVQVVELLQESIKHLVGRTTVSAARWARAGGGHWVVVPARGDYGGFVVGDHVRVTKRDTTQRNVEIIAVVRDASAHYAVPYDNRYPNGYPYGFDYAVKPWVFVGAGFYLADRKSGYVYDYWRRRMREVNAAADHPERDKWLDCELSSQVLPDAMGEA